MTMLFVAELTDIIVANGASDSRVVDVKKEIGDAESVCLYAPADLDGKTYSILVSKDGTNYMTLTDGDGVNIALPAANCAIVYNGIFSAFLFMKIHASAATSKDVTFQASKSFRAGD